jgi:hypothetical protein
VCYRLLFEAIPQGGTGKVGKVNVGCRMALHLVHAILIPTAEKERKVQHRWEMASVINNEIPPLLLLPYLFD